MPFLAPVAMALFLWGRSFFAGCAALNPHFRNLLVHFFQELTLGTRRSPWCEVGGVLGGCIGATRQIHAIVSCKATGSNVQPALFSLQPRARLPWPALRWVGGSSLQQVQPAHIHENHDGDKDGGDINIHFHRA